MLRCSRCKIMFDEYYYMSDGRILCRDCWREELNLAEMKAVQGSQQRSQQRAQVLRDKYAFDQKRKADQVRLEQLDHAIKLEKGKYQRAWSNYDEDSNFYDKPFNYEEVELLKRQRLDLYRQLIDNQQFKFPSIPPFSDNTAYYHRARFISKSQSRYFETVTLPAEQEAKRKAEQERFRAEQKRIAAEQERQKKEAEERLRRAEEERKQKEAELRPYEEGVLGRKILPIEMRIKVARETSKEEVMMLCAKASIASVVEALKQNPNLTPKVRETIQANIKAEQQRLAEEKAQKEAELLEKERIKTAIRWVVGLAIAAGLIFLIIRYWHTISVILIVIFVLFILIK